MHEEPFPQASTITARKEFQSLNIRAGAVVLLDPAGRAICGPQGLEVG